MATRRNQEKNAAKAFDIQSKLQQGGWLANGGEVIVDHDGITPSRKSGAAATITAISGVTGLSLDILVEDGVIVGISGTDKLNDFDFELEEQDLDDPMVKWERDGVEALMQRMIEEEYGE